MSRSYSEWACDEGFEDALERIVTHCLLETSLVLDCLPGDSEKACREMARKLLQKDNGWILRYAGKLLDNFVRDSTDRIVEYHCDSCDRVGPDGYIDRHDADVELYNAVEDLGIGLITDIALTEDGKVDIDFNPLICPCCAHDLEFRNPDSLNSGLWCSACCRGFVLTEAQ